MQENVYTGHFSTMARYNLWATERLLEVVSVVSEEDYRKDCGLFFKSIHGTLNHLLLADQLIWYRRFAEGVSPRLDLNEEIENNRSHLAQRLLEGAEKWQPFIASLPAERFLGKLDYHSIQGKPVSLPFADALSHVFNHSTHHRGQITTALTQLDLPCPVLDLVYMLLEEQEAARSNSGN